MKLGTGNQIMIDKFHRASQYLGEFDVVEINKIEPKTWLMYVLRCSDGSLYTGTTNNLLRRLHQHNNTKSGSKCVRSRRPAVLVAYWLADSRSQACRAENGFQGITKLCKEEFIADMKNIEGFRYLTTYVPVAVSFYARRQWDSYVRPAQS